MLKESSTLVSVVICTYNGEEYLRLALDSVLEQTYKNIDIVIVDDGSFDSTAQIIKQYASKDQRIRYFIRTNHGLPASRNFAFLKCLGDWIAIIDQDDLCYKDRIYEQLQVANRFPDVGIIFCNTNRIDCNGVVLGDHLSHFKLPDAFISKKIAAELLLKQGCYVDSEAWFFRRDILGKVGALDANLRYACDYDFFIRAGLMYDFAYTDKTLSAWRIHPNQESEVNPKRFIEYRAVLSMYLFNTQISHFTKIFLFKNLIRSYAGDGYRWVKRALTYV
jgi:glycosyltransferase involved in cell wall biosynthesis